MIPPKAPHVITILEPSQKNHSEGPVRQPNPQVLQSPKISITDFIPLHTPLPPQKKKTTTNRFRPGQELKCTIQSSGTSSINQNFVCVDKPPLIGKTLLTPDYRGTSFCNPAQKTFKKIGWFIFIAKRKPHSLDSDYYRRRGCGGLIEMRGLVGGPMDIEEIVYRSGWKSWTVWLEETERDCSFLGNFCGGVSGQWLRPSIWNTYLDSGLILPALRVSEYVDGRINVDMDDYRVRNSRDGKPFGLQSYIALTIREDRYKIQGWRQKHPKNLHYHASSSSLNRENPQAGRKENRVDGFAVQPPRITIKH